MATTLLSLALSFRRVAQTPCAIAGTRRRSAVSWNSTTLRNRENWKALGQLFREAPSS